VTRLLLLTLLRAVLGYHESLTTSDGSLKFVFHDAIIQNESRSFADFPPLIGIILQDFKVQKFNLSLGRGQSSPVAHGATLQAWSSDVAFERLAMSLRVFGITLDALGTIENRKPVLVPNGSRIVHATYPGFCVEQLLELFRLLPTNSTFLDIPTFSGSEYAYAILAAEKVEKTFTFSLTLEYSLKSLQSTNTMKSLPVKKYIQSDSDLSGTLIYDFYKSHSQASEEFQLIDPLPPLIEIYTSQITTDCAHLLMQPVIDNKIHLKITTKDEKCSVFIPIWKEVPAIEFYTANFVNGVELSGAYFKGLDNLWRATKGVSVQTVPLSFAMSYNTLAVMSTLLFMYYGILLEEISPTKKTSTILNKLRVVFKRIQKRLLLISRT
jgi:hypothetical protein